MDIQADLSWIHQEIDKVKDITFIKKLRHLLENSTNNESISEYNTDIDNALKSIENGNYYSEEDARTFSKKWGRK